MSENRKKRVMLIGNTGAGKTTLTQFLSKQELKYSKTQTVQIVNENIIDTPGEYLAYSYFRGTMMVTACDADIIIFVQDASAATTMFPPAYSSLFGKPALGVVTKADLATAEQIEKAKKYLLMAGASKIFVTSSYEGSGFEELSKVLGFE